MARVASPMTPPYHSIPPSDSTVTVRLIDSCTTLTLNNDTFWQPNPKSFQGYTVPCFSFLITYGRTHILFDLGVRNDWHNLSLSTLKEVLNSDSIASVKRSGFDAIVLSHFHFDHMGDPSTFPPSTKLVVGAGMKDSCLPGYPADEAAFVLESDFAGREVQEVDFSSRQKIGRFDAFDYFGDGSLYLLNAPGHCPGQMCDLARVTCKPDSFVFLGGDACHHVGVLRPSRYLPLLQDRETVLKMHPTHDATVPFSEPSIAIFPRYEDAKGTIGKIIELDAYKNLLVALAHNASLQKVVKRFPEGMNDWMAGSVKMRLRWGFLKDLEKASEVL